MSPESPTGSTATRVIGTAALISMALLLCAAFWWSEPDDQQGEAVRLFYLHVPVAILEYAAFIIAGVGSVMYLWKRSAFGDLLAHAAAEVGVVFCGLTLVTGSLWGRPTWGTYWDWGDVRLVTTLVLFLMYVGYLALRQVPGDPHTRSRQAAVVALVAGAPDGVGIVIAAAGSGHERQRSDRHHEGTQFPHTGSSPLLCFSDDAPSAEAIVCKYATLRATSRIGPSPSAGRPSVSAASCSIT